MGAPAPICGTFVFNYPTLAEAYKAALNGLNRLVRSTAADTAAGPAVQG